MGKSDTKLEKVMVYLGEWRGRVFITLDRDKDPKVLYARTPNHKHEVSFASPADQIGAHLTSVLARDFNGHFLSGRCSYCPTENKES